MNNLLRIENTDSPWVFVLCWGGRGRCVMIEAGAPLRVRAPRPYSWSPCLFCEGPARHGYMLRDELWNRLGLGYDDMACLDFLAERLGRPFSVDDFTDAPLNWGIVRAIKLLASGRGVPGRHCEETKVIIVTNPRAKVVGSMPELPY